MYKQIFIGFIIIGKVYSAQLPRYGCWHNWDSSIICRNVYLYSPKLADQIPTMGGPFRIVGSGHAWGLPCCNSNGIVFTKNFMSAPELITQNSEQIVKVGAGVSLGDLLKFLQDNGRTLETFPNLPKITVGGAVATGAHGTSFNEGTISNSVVGVEVHPQFVDNIDLRAFATNVGKLGVVTTLSLRTIPIITLVRRVDTITTQNLFALWSDLIKDNVRLQFWYDFYTQKVLVLRYKFPGQEFPSLPNVQPTGFLAELAQRLGQSTTGTLPELMLAANLQPRLEAEYAVNRDLSLQAITAIQNFVLKNNIPINRPMLIRFGGTDTLPWLSPALDAPGGVTYFNIDMTPGSYCALNQFEEFIINNFNARPHWGKYHTNRERLLFKAFGFRINQFSQYQGKKLRDLYGSIY